MGHCKMRAEGSIQSPTRITKLVSFQVLLKINACMYLHDCDPRLGYDFLKKKKETAPHLGCDILCKMARCPRFGCLYDLVSNPRLGCFGEIDSRGYGTHLNGTCLPGPVTGTRLRGYFITWFYEMALQWKYDRDISLDTIWIIRNQRALCHGVVSQTRPGPSGHRSSHRFLHDILVQLLIMKVQDLSDSTSKEGELTTGTYINSPQFLLIAQFDI